MIIQTDKNLLFSTLTFHTCIMLLYNLHKFTYLFNVLLVLYPFEVSVHYYILEYHVMLLYTFAYLCILFHEGLILLNIFLSLHTFAYLCILLYGHKKVVKGGKDLCNILVWKYCYFSAIVLICHGQIFWIFIIFSIILFLYI